MTDNRVVYCFTVPGAPCSVNRIFRFRHGHAYTSPKSKAYKQLVESIARDAGIETLEGDIRLSVTYHHQHPNRRLDLDNVLKVLIDGLGYAFNDRQIVRLSISREHCPEAPRVEVRLECLSST